MSLFQWGNFTLHSGEQTWWRIDCDALSESEIELLARLIIEKAGDFNGVTCPESHPGSVASKLVQILSKASTHKHAGRETMLVVDDVLTTGNSMNHKKDIWDHNGWNVKGAVIFARGECPDWVTPLFRM